MPRHCGPVRSAPPKFQRPVTRAAHQRDGVELGKSGKGFVRELLRALVENRLRLIAPVFRLEFGAHLLERALVRRPHVVETDDVISETRLDRSADLALLHREERFGKGRLISLLE